MALVFVVSEIQGLRGCNRGTWLNAGQCVTDLSISNEAIAGFQGGGRLLRTCCSCSGVNAGGCEGYLRGVSPHAVDVGAELGVLDAVHLHDIHGGLVHAVVFVCQFVPGRL